MTYGFVTFCPCTCLDSRDVNVMMSSEGQRYLEKQIADVEERLRDLRATEITDEDTKRLIVETEQTLDIARRYLRALNESSRRSLQK
jgi:hypothetical protein